MLYGCLRYKDALRVFLKHYYNDMASSVLRVDYALYMVLGYLLLFRLDELGFDEFRKLTTSEDPTKMAHLLKYLINWERVEVSSPGQTNRIFQQKSKTATIMRLFRDGIKRPKTSHRKCTDRYRRNNGARIVVRIEHWKGRLRYLVCTCVSK